MARVPIPGRSSFGQHPLSPGRDGGNVAGGEVKRNPRSDGRRDWAGKVEIPLPFPLRRSPPRAREVSGSGRACWGAGMSARRGSGYAFYPGFRCAAPGATLGAPLRGWRYGVFPGVETLKERLMKSACISSSYPYSHPFFRLHASADENLSRFPV